MISLHLHLSSSPHLARAHGRTHLFLDRSALVVTVDVSREARVDEVLTGISELHEADALHVSGDKRGK